MAFGRMGRIVVLVAGFAGFGIGGCVPAVVDTPNRINLGNGLQGEALVTGASSPSSLAPAADGRVFYTERTTGRIRVIQQGILVDTPFAQVPVNTVGEGGLLGIALHPEFASNGRVYVFYTRSSTGVVSNDPDAVLDNRVVYFVANGNQAQGAEVFVASFSANGVGARLGGRLAFAGDGSLLIGVGDLTDRDAAGNPDRLVGKIVRLDANGDIPVDNPNPESAVYASGVRDVRGLCADPFGAVGFMVDRYGQGWEEINRIAAGADYGWPTVAGQTGEDDFADPLIDSGARRPLYVGCSVNPSGKYGPQWRERLFFAENATSTIYGMELTEGRTAAIARDRFASGFPTTINDLAFTPAGTLYVATEDAVLRIVASQ